MKIAITSASDSIDGNLDNRFGRSNGFLVFDEDFSTYTYIDNAQNIQAAQGAGIQSAQNVIEAGVGCVISGQCGPKALRVLQSANVKVYNCPEQPIKKCIEQYKSGMLSQVVGE